MKKGLKIALVVAITLMMSSNVFAQEHKSSGHETPAHAKTSEHEGMPSHSLDMPSDAVFSGVGVVIKIDDANKKVTIKHEPIAALKWGEMTMRFTYEDASMVKNIKAGDKIHFDFVQKDGGKISLLKKVSVAH